MVDNKFSKENCLERTLPLFDKTITKTVHKEEGENR